MPDPTSRRPTSRTLIAVLAVLGLLAAGCGDDDGSAGDDDGSSAEASEAVTVSDPWSRATPPNAETGAVYLGLEADEDDALIGASVDSSIAGTVELHEVVAADGGMENMGDMDDGDMEDMDDGDMEDMDDGDMEGMEGMRMQQVTEIPLPAGEEVTLEPGGYHIMLVDLAEPLEAGDSFEVTLQFESAGTRTVTAEVREA